MPKLNVFNHVTLDGYFCSASGDMRWAHTGMDDPEWLQFVAGNARGDGRLVFGRKTYDMMAGFWPTPAAQQRDAALAASMNARAKIVFSRTLDAAPWNNTRLIKGDLVTEMRALKNDGGPDMVILGSGSLVAQLAAAGLVDSYQLVVNPIALGAGRTLFEGLPAPVSLKLTQSRTFKNGKTVLWYAPEPE